MTERSRLQKIMDSAPKGVGQDMEILQGIVNGESAEIIDEAEGQRLTPESPFEKTFQVSQETENLQIDRGQAPEDGFGEHEQESGMQLREGPRSSESTSSQGLNVLPTGQQEQLNSISQELLAKISEGPSSLIDQDVVQLLQNLPRESRATFGEMLLSPKQAYRELAAKGDEREARATLRGSVAQTALTIAKLAEEDMKRKVFELFIQQLEKTESRDMEVYCNEHNMSVPQEGSIQRMVVLIRVHSSKLALADYKVALHKQVKSLVETRASMEGDIDMSNMKADMLPGLIAARKVEYPLQQKRIFQTVGHSTAIVTGSVASVVSGAVGGAVSGAYYGFEEGWETTKEKVKSIRLPKIHLRNPFKK